MMYRAGDVAAAIHSFMCEDSRFGYTQGPGRWGNSPSGEVAVFEWQGFKYEIPAGDYDCSSSVVMAWQKALEPTPYKGALGEGGYNSCGMWVSWYTGNIGPGFRASGLFASKSTAFLASPGDLYLQTAHHVAMCQTQYPDVLSEFLSNEVGGIIGGIIGDQTGNESLVRAYYDWPDGGWSCIMHYNGKADFEIGEDMTPQDVWAYRNKDIAPIDAYAYLIETHTMCKQLMREVTHLESEVIKLKNERKG